MPKPELHFTVDSQLLAELGERLVTRNYLALAELVKNAYDADATQVTIRFVNGQEVDEELLSEIRVEDDGHGMTRREVESSWMRIATAGKKREPTSPLYGRPKAGNKGIGRFACQRLAHGLVLDTCAQLPGKRFERTRVIFKWEDFKEGSDVTEIPCIAKTTTSKSGRVGTTLYLKALREAWTQRDFDALRRRMLSLPAVGAVRRKGFREDPGFEISLAADEFESGEGLLVDQLLNAGWGTLEGRIDKQGRVRLGLQAKLIGKREHELPERFPKLASISFTVSHFPNKKQYFRNKRTLSQEVLKEIRDEVGGVAVYFNGFRVYPYGMPGDDWLSLDRDVARRHGKVDDALSDSAGKLRLDGSRVLLDLPRNSQLIGRVKIDSGSVSSLQVKMDREGFLENPAFSSLRRAMRLAIEWMTLNYSAFRRRLSKQELEEAAGELELVTPAQGDTKPIQSALTVLKSLAMSAEGSAASRSDAGTRAEAVISKTFELQEAELRVLRGLASTGPVMFAFAHELRTVGSRLDVHAEKLRQLAASVGKSHASQFRTLAEDFRTTRQRLDEQMRLFGIFARSHSAKPRRHYLRKAVDEVCSAYSFLCDTFGVGVKCSRVSPDLKVGPLTSAELYSVLINVMSNALKSVIAGRGERIEFRAKKRAEGVVVTVLDDGLGLSSDYWDAVFEPLTSDPSGALYRRLDREINDKETAALGRGTGIGLSIVRGILATRAGQIRFVAPPEEWSAAVEVELP